MFSIKKLLQLLLLFLAAPDLQFNHTDHNYRCVTRIDLKKEQEKFCNKIWKSGKESGSIVLLRC